MNPVITKIIRPKHDNHVEQGLDSLDGKRISKRDSCGWAWLWPVSYLLQSWYLSLNEDISFLSFSALCYLFWFNLKMIRAMELPVMSPLMSPLLRHCISVSRNSSVAFSYFSLYSIAFSIELRLTEYVKFFKFTPFSSLLLFYQWFSTMSAVMLFVIFSCLSFQ